MHKLLVTALMGLAAVAFAQQQVTPPPASTPPTFPQPDKDVGRQMPPDTPAKAPSSADVQQQIQDKLKSEPGLSGAKLKVKVTNSTVTLSGRVADDAQRRAARQIAESYAGARKIVDQIQEK